MNKCECGCGQLVKKRFARGHSLRVFHFSGSVKGKRPDVAERNRINNKLHTGENAYHWKGGKTEERHQEQLIREKRYKMKNKLIVLTHYGGNPPKCACCGETHIEFLTIDHINGGGCKHRKQIGTNNINRWLIKNNFPEGYRVLCMNCNTSRGFYGYCPHQEGMVEQ